MVITAYPVSMLIHASMCRWASRLDDESVEHLFGDVSGEVEQGQGSAASRSLLPSSPAVAVQCSTAWAMQHSAIPHQADFVGSFCQQ